MEMDLARKCRMGTGRSQIGMNRPRHTARELLEYECSQFLCNLFVNKVKGTNIPLGNHDIIDTGWNTVLLETEKFPHNPLYTVTLDGISHFLAHGETEPPRSVILPGADKQDETGRKIPTAP